MQAEAGAASGPSAGVEGEDLLLAARVLGGGKISPPREGEAACGGRGGARTIHSPPNAAVAIAGGGAAAPADRAAGARGVLRPL